MKRLFLDCQMGIAGDMLTACLLGLLDNPYEGIRELNQLGIPHVTYGLEEKEDKGICGYHCIVSVEGCVEGNIHANADAHNHIQLDHNQQHTSVTHSHNHNHPHQHTSITHGHNHNQTATVLPIHTLHDVEHIINSLHASPEVKHHAQQIYRLIAEAEAAVHHTEVGAVHFHEVGAYDAIADIVAVCYLLDTLDFQSIIVSPIHVGYGSTHCAHGELTVPAPATRLLLQGMPWYTDYQVQGELCTPTGAALAKYFGQQFGAMPVMNVTGMSYGFGTKQCSRPNCIAAYVDTVEDDTDDIVEIACNIDDMTGEEIGAAIDQLLQLPVLDVFTTPIMMKKQRPAVMVTVLCKAIDFEQVRQTIFVHTTTLGVRWMRKQRSILQREEGQVFYKNHKIRYKKAFGPHGERIKFEFDDLQTLAKELDMSLLDVKSELLKSDNI